MYCVKCKKKKKKLPIHRMYNLSSVEMGET